MGGILITLSFSSLLPNPIAASLEGGVGGRGGGGNGGTVLDWKGKARPVVQYAIMIDAGSTGSRVHVYKVSKSFSIMSAQVQSDLALSISSLTFVIRPPSWRMRYFI